MPDAKNLFDDVQVGDRLLLVTDDETYPVQVESVTPVRYLFVEAMPGSDLFLGRRRFNKHDGRSNYFIKGKGSPRVVPIGMETMVLHRNRVAAARGDVSAALSEIQAVHYNGTGEELRQRLIEAIRMVDVYIRVRDEDVEGNEDDSH